MAGGSVIKALIPFLLALGVLFLAFTRVNAQACGGSYQCCAGSVTIECLCPRDENLNCHCGTAQVCSGPITTRTCSNSLNCSPYDIPNPCDGGAVMFASCYGTGSCGPGTQYCGGALQTCCPNTQTCNTWLAQGSCPGSDPDPGGPVGPPGCTPRSSGWMSGRPNFSFVESPNGGPSWDSVDEMYFLRTDNTLGQVTVAWDQPTGGIDTVEYRFIPYDQVQASNASDQNGSVGCNHIWAKCGTLGGSASSFSFRPREHRYYRLRLRFRNECQGVWSAWREQIVRIDGQITGRILVLSGGQVASHVGLSGTCSSPDGVAYSNFPGSVRAVGDSYGQSDFSIHSTSARYRTWLPYQNPGAVALSLSAIPAGYTVACPVGGTYNSGNSSIAAPFLSNGTTGSVVDANFYLCSVGVLASPTVANIVSPLPDSEVVPSLVTGVYRVMLQFAKPVGSRLEYRVYPTGEVPPETGVTVGSVADTHVSDTFIPTTSEYSLQLRFIRTACGAVERSEWSPVRQFSVVGTITGTTYEDPSAAGSSAFSFCPAVAGVFPNPSGTVTAAGGVTHRTGAAYSIKVPWGNESGLVQYSPASVEAMCSCPTGCTFGSIPLMTANVNFFSSMVSQAWWQVSGGPVLALGNAGVVVRSQIPSTCVPPECQPYLLSAQNGAGSSQYVVTGQSQDGVDVGEVDVSPDSGQQSGEIDSAGLNIVAHTNFPRVEEVYDTFVRRYAFARVARRQDDFDGVDARPTATAARKPEHTPRNFFGKVTAEKSGAYWSARDLTISDPWSVAAGEMVVVLVEGDLEVAATTQVDEGGFLAFFVQGDINISPELGQSDPASTVSVVEGVYVADGWLNVLSRGEEAGGDLKFVGAGTFVGWSGVNLNRSFHDGGAGNVRNNTAPSELFIYRPDFLLSAPKEIKTPQYSWREVAP